MREECGSCRNSGEGGATREKNGQGVFNQRNGHEAIAREHMENVVRKGWVNVVWECFRELYFRRNEEDCVVRGEQR